MLASLLDHRNHNDRKTFVELGVNTFLPALEKGDPENQVDKGGYVSAQKRHLLVVDLTSSSTQEGPGEKGAGVLSRD